MSKPKAECYDLRDLIVNKPDDKTKKMMTLSPFIQV